jgi:hypothetical protein
MDDSHKDFLGDPDRNLKWLIWFRRGVSLCVIAGVWFYLQSQERQTQAADRPMPQSLEIIRAKVQRGVDPDARFVNLQPENMTVGLLRQVDRPATLNLRRQEFAQTRIAPFETQVWKIRARVAQIRLRTDGDLYIVIESDGKRACVELPDPSHCEGSPFYSQIKKLRAEIEQRYQLSVKPVAVNRMALLTGVGFFGTGGVRDNGARLHPLLAIRWLDE